mgnify:CR=1 FL=1
MKLVIDNVSKSFVSRTGHTLPVLQDINLTVNEEEFVALVGPSGCGKSTLLNITAGLLARQAAALASRICRRGMYRAPALFFRKLGFSPGAAFTIISPLGWKQWACPGRNKRPYKHYINLVA